MFAILAWWVGIALATGLGALAAVGAVASYRRQYKFRTTVSAGSIALLLWTSIGIMLTVLDH